MHSIDFQWKFKWMRDTMITLSVPRMGNYNLEIRILGFFDRLQY